MQSIVVSAINNFYFELGESVGKAYQEGKKLNKWFCKIVLVKSAFYYLKCYGK